VAHTWQVLKLGKAAGHLTTMALKQQLQHRGPKEKGVCQAGQVGEVPLIGYMAQPGSGGVPTGTSSAVWQPLQ
jgi:hypothetical protein